MAAPSLRGARFTPVIAGLLLLGLGCSSGKSDAAADGGAGVMAAGGRTSDGSSGTVGAGGATSAAGQTGTTSAGGGSTSSDAAVGGSPQDANAVDAKDEPRKDAAVDRPPSKDPTDGPPVKPDVTAPDLSPGKKDTSDDQGPRGDAGIVVPAGYKLVWSDEFDVDGKPDPKNWNYEKGFVRNNELQWYQPDNATIKDGLLIIEGRKERVSNPNYKATSTEWKTSRQYAEYTSTSMTTSGLQTWQYGRLEMRGRIPTNAGMWPAWWTLGVKGEWPSNGEIDIMEYYNGKVLANIACGTDKQWTAKWDSATKSLSSLGTGWSDKFHVWRMDWDDQKIDLTLDDTLMNSATLASMLNADGTSPFKQKVYMILNLAIGGDNGGDPSGTTFPVKYEIDYVRVFQKI